MNTKGIIRVISKWVRNNSTKLLAGLAIGTEALGFYFMHKEAPIVRDRLEELPEGATWKDKIKVAGPVYLPAVGMMLLSSGCIVGGCALGEKRVAIMSGLYTASEAALRKYEEKVVDAIGHEKANDIQQSIAQDLMREKPASQMNVCATGKGDQLFYEPLSGRYFTSEKNAVVAAMNEANRICVGEMWIRVNEWFEQLGLEEVGLGDMVGWNVDHLIDISFTPASTPDDRTCFVIGYYYPPILYK